MPLWHWGKSRTKEFKDNDSYFKSYIGKKAAEALGNIGDKRAVEPLISALKYKDRGMRRCAAEALGKIGDTRAIEPLIFSLKELQFYGYGKEVEENAIGALGKIGETAIEPLISALKDNDSNLRKNVTEALGNIEDTKAVEPLIYTLKDSDLNVRKNAAKALRKIGWKPEKNEIGATFWINLEKWDECVKMGAMAVKPLISALKDKDWNVRKNAARALGEIREPAVESLISALKDEDWNVRTNAVDALGEIGNTKAVEPLISALKYQDHDMQRCAALALGEIGDTRAIEPLISALKDKDKSVRANAAGALREIGDTRAIEPLISALKDEYMYVRKNAAEFLVGIYKNEKLDDKIKSQILSNQHIIKQAHNDGSRPSDCMGHFDSGIGVDFPT